MPKDEDFWNPYRWVTLSKESAQLAEPSYHHRASGLSGQLCCELTALTPLFVGNGNGEFVHHQSRNPHDYYIPSTSLKGMIRSLAEVISNSEAPFHNSQSNTSRMDIVARTFGYLQKGSVFRGLIRFSDAQMVSSPTRPWPCYLVAVGRPKKEHESFYPQRDRRKFYHHQPGVQQLNASPSDKQTRAVQPAPCGTRFAFKVDFTNLRDLELALLLYCLALEEQVTVTLTPEALGPGVQAPVTVRGPLRHKMGGAKPQGAGSVHIGITQMQLRDAKARYQGNDTSQTWETEDIVREISDRTRSFRNRDDRTISELRAMLIYSEQDPRKPVRYPPWEWFTKNSSRELKPTL